MSASSDAAGIVVIGRNEGDRLRACLRSLRATPHLVYVDSGSTDGSQEFARSLGVEVVDLPPVPGFTAARARNAGIARLLQVEPALSFAQTIDGDCELRDGWIEGAVAAMDSDPAAAVVFGRRRERRADANIYHRACDNEWDVPTGLVASCGGDALFRLSAFQQVGGYNPSLIAGEEPDLCLRLRQRGWHIRSNGREMTLHDIAMDRFGQWWRRARRAGFAMTELAWRHGRDADPAWVRLVRSALGWSAVLLATVGLLLAAVIFARPILFAGGSAGAALVMLQIARTSWRMKRRMRGLRYSFGWALLIMAAKLAEAQGWAEFHFKRLGKREARIIEYKS